MGIVPFMSFYFLKLGLLEYPLLLIVKSWQSQSG